MFRRYVLDLKAKTYTSYHCLLWQFSLNLNLKIRATIAQKDLFLAIVGLFLFLKTLSGFFPNFLSWIKMRVERTETTIFFLICRADHVNWIHANPWFCTIQFVPLMLHSRASELCLVYFMCAFLTALRPTQPALISVVHVTIDIGFEIWMKSCSTRRAVKSEGELCDNCMNHMLTTHFMAISMRHKFSKRATGTYL